MQPSTRRKNLFQNVRDLQPFVRRSKREILCLVTSRERFALRATRINEMTLPRHRIFLVRSRNTRFNRSVIFFTGFYLHRSCTLKAIRRYYMYVNTGIHFTYSAFSYRSVPYASRGRYSPNTYM